MKLKIVAAALVVAGLSACASKAEKESKELLKASQMPAAEQRALAAQLYRAGRASLDATEYSVAIERYETLAKRFPFTDYAVQGQLEQIYAEFRSYKTDEALTSADHFLRDYPRHKDADWVQYIKGLINFERDRGLEALLGVDVSKRDATNLRRSFDDFATLIQKYPDSRFVGDARQRMIDLRNRIAEHEMSVVRYYMRRGAYLAAAKRAEQVVGVYPGSPATIEALTLLEKAYSEVKLDAQAEDARRLHAAYLDPNSAKAAAPPVSAPLKPAPVTAPPALPARPLPEPASDAPQAPTSQTAPPPG